MRGVSGLWSSALAVGTIGQDVGRRGDRMAFRLSQLLRVEAAHAQLRWVSGRSPDGEVELQQAELGLEASGRQVDLGVAYSRPWADGQVHIAAIASPVQDMWEASETFRLSRTTVADSGPDQS